MPPFATNVRVPPRRERLGTEERDRFGEPLASSDVCLRVTEERESFSAFLTQICT